MIVFVKIAFLLLCFTKPGLGQYEDEYKDMDEKNSKMDKDFEKNFVTVSSDGEVMPFHLNPIKAGDDEKPIRRIPEKKVVGGVTSNPGAVPYIVSIKRNGRSRCGGAIYKSDKIITAAHCFSNTFGPLPDYEIQLRTIVAGEFDLKADEGNEQIRNIIDFKLHPGYDPSKSFDDIAIITVDRPFEYNEFVQPIPISGPKSDLAGQSAMITGWGYTAQRQGSHDPPIAEFYPAALQESHINIFTQDECHNFYDVLVEDAIPLIDAGTICAGFESGKVDACQGDSGGPLACYNPEKGNSRYLCGVVCTGIGCGLPGFPGFYTRVSDYCDWIKEVAGCGDARTVDDSRDDIPIA